MSKPKKSPARRTKNAEAATKPVKLESPLAPSTTTKRRSEGFKQRQNGGRRVSTGRGSSSGGVLTRIPMTPEEAAWFESEAAAAGITVQALIRRLIDETMRASR